MNKKIEELFTDKKLIEKIQKKLPKLFQLAELESSRAGKIGMEVGSIREKIIVALLIYKFGEKNIDTEIPITESEIDVKVFGNPVSIKTITGKNIGSIKLIWTVDAKKASEFRRNYKPNCDMILVHINWNKEGALFYIPLHIQHAVLKQLGVKKYIKLPKAGTNPRGVEITTNALRILVNHNKTLRINIEWFKKDIKFNAFKRWLDLWEQD